MPIPLSRVPGALRPTGQRALGQAALLLLLLLLSLGFTVPSQAQLKQITDPGITTSYARDSLKRLTSKTQSLTDAPPLTHHVHYQWVPAGTGGGGELAAIVYPSGKVLTYQYDATSQITTVLWNGQPIASELRWSPLGLPTAWRWPFTGGQAGTGLAATHLQAPAGVWSSQGRTQQPSLAEQTGLIVSL